MSLPKSVFSVCWLCCPAASIFVPQLRCCNPDNNDNNNKDVSFTLLIFLACSGDSDKTDCKCEKIIFKKGTSSGHKANEFLLNADATVQQWNSGKISWHPKTKDRFNRSWIVSWRALTWSEAEARIFFSSFKHSERIMAKFSGWSWNCF